MSMGILEPHHSGCICALRGCSLGCMRWAVTMNHELAVRFDTGLIFWPATRSHASCHLWILRSEASGGDLASDLRRPAKHKPQVPDCCAKPFAILVVGGGVGLLKPCAFRVLHLSTLMCFACFSPATDRRRFTLDAGAPRQCVCAFQARLYFLRRPKPERPTGPRNRRSPRHPHWKSHPWADPRCLLVPTIPKYPILSPTKVLSSGAVR